MATRITASLLDAWGGDLLVTPLWFTFGLSHSHLRRIDPHWNLFDGRENRQVGGRDQWDWEPRVHRLVKKEFFAGAEEMFAWKTYEGLHERDHLVAWSKVEFLMTELEGDRRAFLGAICSATDGPDGELAARQGAALQEHFGLTPEALDRAWSRWVLKTHRKR